MAKRRNPTTVDVPKMDADEEKVSQMHSALYALSDKIRKPFKSSGEKLLPKSLQSPTNPEAKAARAHIRKLHGAMCAEK